MNIAFTLGAEAISGGTNVIFEHAIRLNRIPGHKITIITDHIVDKENGLAWHPEARELEFDTYENCELQDSEFDIVVITWWRTVFDAHRINANKYCYFVQSIESRFYSGKDYEFLIRLAESTYRLGLPVITEATWIKKYLEEKHSATCHLVRNGIRKEYYDNRVQPLSAREPGKLRVLIEGPLGVKFKNTELALNLAKAAGVDETWLLTSSQNADHKSADRIFSAVPIRDTGAIYKSCDLVIKLSYVEGMFGPPLESFHCGGTAVVYDVTGHDEYMIHNHNSIVIPTDDEAAVIDSLRELKRSPSLLKRLQTNALETSRQWWTWDEAAAAFGIALSEIYKAPSPTRESLRISSQFFFDWYVAADTLRKAHKHRSKYNVLAPIKFIGRKAKKLFL